MDEFRACLQYFLKLRVECKLQCHILCTPNHVLLQLLALLAVCRLMSEQEEAGSSTRVHKLDSDCVCGALAGGRAQQCVPCSSAAAGSASPRGRQP